MIFRITDVRVAGPHHLRRAFDDGTCKTADVSPLLSGPVFEPLKDPAFFARATLDPISGTVVWPNQADFALEALRDLSPVEESTAA